MRFFSLALVIFVASAAAAQVDLSSTPVAQGGGQCASLLPRFDMALAGAPAVAPLQLEKPKPWKFRDAYKQRTCTGYSCGCYDAEAECMALCPPEGQPGHLDCVTDCGRESRRCGICCCCDPTQWCPTYC